MERQNWVPSFDPTTAAMLLGLAASMLIGCNNVDVAISGLKLKIATNKSPAPAWNQVNGERQTLTAGGYVMTVQTGAANQTQLAAGPYKMSVEVVK